MTLSTVPYALVVDDDPLIMMDTTSILKDAGFRFYEAMDGDEAKQILSANWESIVLLFSDVDMPGETNGFALARHVAEHWPAIEIVIASGHVLPKTGDMPEKTTFISKPFNKHMVHEHLLEMLPDNKLPEPLKKAV
jgi:DNA-binding NtrC family response regulator